jgi:hypothetical protein
MVGKDGVGICGCFNDHWLIQWFSMSKAFGFLCGGLKFSEKVSIKIKLEC